MAERTLEIFFHFLFFFLFFLFSSKIAKFNSKRRQGGPHACLERKLTLPLVLKCYWATDVPNPNQEIHVVDFDRNGDEINGGDAFF